MVVKHIWLQLNAKNIVQGKYLFGKDKTIGKKNYADPSIIYSYTHF